MTNILPPHHKYHHLGDIGCMIADALEMLRDEDPLVMAREMFRVSSIMQVGSSRNGLFTGLPVITSKTWRQVQNERRWIKDWSSDWTAALKK